MCLSEIIAPASPRRLDRRQNVLDHLAGGLVTLLIGAAFLFVARGFTVLAIPGVICVAVGVGLLFVGSFIYPFMKSPPQAR